MYKKFENLEHEVKTRMRGGEGEVHMDHFWRGGEGGELRSANRLFAKLTLEPGASIGFHRHENEEEVFVVIRGEAEMDDDGEIVKLGPGDTICTGNGAGHSVKSIGSCPLEMLAVINLYNGK